MQVFHCGFVFKKKSRRPYASLDSQQPEQKKSLRRSFALVKRIYFCSIKIVCDYRYTILPGYLALFVPSQVL